MTFCLSTESPHTLPRVFPQPNRCLDISCILSWTYSYQVLLTRYSAIKICKSRHMITMLDTDNYSLVLAMNHGQGLPWISGKVLKQSGAVTFMVELTDETVIYRHLDQLMLDMTNPVEAESEPSTSADVSILDCTPSPKVSTP